MVPNFIDRSIWGANQFGYIEGGLPNITGKFDESDRGQSASGAFYIGARNATARGDDNGGAGYWCHIDASRSSKLYKNNFNMVQPTSVAVRVKTRYR